MIRLHPIGWTYGRGDETVKAGVLDVNPDHISAMGPESAYVTGIPPGRCGNTSRDYMLPGSFGSYLVITATRLLINGASVLVYESIEEIGKLKAAA